MSYALRTTPYALAALLLFALPAFAQAPAPADAESADAYGLNATANAAGLLKDNKAKTLPEVIGRVINAALSLLGIAFFLLMLYAGFRWMTAQGEPEVVKKSRDTIVAAVIGLAIVIAAYAAVNFIFENVIP